ncbi:MAG: hypothetical protein KC492_04660, partial [Myxococcales bacterium]|nr:hypothetical protein [Myxococcales bacterium]
MGITRFFKQLFAAKPLKVDYTTFTNDRLRQLWDERADLTDEARSALQSEAERRGIALARPAVGKKKSKRHAPPLKSPPFSDSTDELSIGYQPDGSIDIQSGASRVVLNEPRQDDDGRPRSPDGLDVARRLLAKLAPQRSLEEPAYTFVEAALLAARAGDSLPAFASTRRGLLAELCCAAAARDSERLLAVSDRDEQLTYYRDALLLPFDAPRVLTRSPQNLHAIVLTAASDRGLAERHLAELADQDLPDGLLVEATLVALDLGLDAKPLLRKWQVPRGNDEGERCHLWRAAEVRRTVRTDLEAALALEVELPAGWRHDDDASLAVAVRLARSDPARAVAIAKEMEADLRHMSWLRGCARESAPGAGELVDEWISAFNSGTYDPYGYFSGVLESCLCLGDVTRTTRCL